MANSKVTQHGYHSLVGGGQVVCPECNTNQVAIRILRQVEGRLYGEFGCDNCCCQFVLERELSEDDSLRHTDFSTIF